jgi:short-subunit dehydrogenase
LPPSDGSWDWGWTDQTEEAERGNPMHVEQNRPLAVVTGASSGIGFELARILAENGYDLVIAAEDAELADAERQLSQTTSVEAVKVDLSTPQGVEDLYQRLSSATRPVEVLALNAGIGAGGAFATETPLDKELELIDLNVRSTVHLCKLVLGDMVGRDEGKILFTSSIASTMPGSFQAVYNASKSFVQSFAQAIRNELKDTGVTVTSLMPGPTETEFFERAGMEDTKIGAEEKDDPAEVARQGFEALMAGREKVVAGSTMNKVQTMAGKIIPDSKKAEMHRQMAEPGSAEEAKR